MRYLDCEYCGRRHISHENIEWCRKVQSTKLFLKQWERHKPTTTAFYEEVAYLLYDQLRGAIYKRFKYSCTLCGKTNVALEMHHIKPISKGGTNEIDNLTALCIPCHHFIHSKKGQIIEENTKLTVF